MNNKTLTIGAAALTVLIVTAGFAVSSFASQNGSVAQEEINTPVTESAFRHGGGGCPMAEGRVSGDGQCSGKNGSGVKGQNVGGNFIDENEDGICDRMQ